MSHCKHTRVLFVVMCGNKIIERVPTTLFGRLVRYSAMGTNDGKNKGGWEQGYNCSTTLLFMVISSLNFREACHGNFGQSKMLV